MSYRLARVAKVYPRRRTADIVFCDDDSRAFSVPILSMDGSSDSGSWRVPSVSRPVSEMTAAGMDPGRRVLLAAVTIAGGRAMILGFVRHQDWSWQPTEDNRWLDRHPSGAFTTIAPDGSIETFHPSGAYLRIGAGAHVDVPGAPASPGGAEPTVTLATANFTLTIAPGGVVTLHAAGSVSIAYQHLTLTGDVSLNGKLEATGDVVAGTISLQGHKHGGVAPGGGTTGVPV